jgi:hypothetical protein
MRDKVSFAKKDIIVACFCAVFLLANLGSVGSSSRRRAKEIVCLSNLRQWGLISQMYTENNDGLFWSGLGTQGYWWPLQLESRLKDWKINRIWFCPTATRPIVGEDGVPIPTFNIFNAWGIFKGSHACNVTGRIYNTGPNGIAGSYSINGYVLTIPTSSTFEGGRPASDGWRTPQVAGVSRVPLFVDALRFDLWPLDTQPPALYEYGAWSGNSMARCCINRHNGAVDVIFMDWSARKVGLKELWTLKWHRNYNTAGPWTKAGGVRPTDWPQWMRNFKDF